MSMIFCFAAKTKGVMGITSFEKLCQLFEEIQKNLLVLEELILILNIQHDYYKNLSSKVAFQDVQRYLAGEVLNGLCVKYLSHFFSKSMCYKESISGEQLAAAKQNIKNICRELNKLCSQGISLNPNQSEVLLKQTKRALADLVSFGLEQFEIRSVLYERSKGLQVHSDVVFFETSKYSEDRCLKIYCTWIERIKKYVVAGNFQNSFEKE